MQEHCESPNKRIYNNNCENISVYIRKYIERVCTCRSNFPGHLHARYFTPGSGISYMNPHCITIIKASQRGACFLSKSWVSNTLHYKITNM
jgi:hypothetical protein